MRTIADPSPVHLWQGGKLPARTHETARPARSNPGRALLIPGGCPRGAGQQSGYGVTVGNAHDQGQRGGFASGVALRVTVGAAVAPASVVSTTPPPPPVRFFPKAQGLRVATPQPLASCRLFLGTNSTQSLHPSRPVSSRATTVARCWGVAGPRNLRCARYNPAARRPAHNRERWGG